MSFQIHNEEGQAIGINELDKEAAEFWGKKVADRSYAHPTPEPEWDKISDSTERFKAEMNYARAVVGNWFDTIGYQIHSPSTNWTSGWDNVKAGLWVIQSTDYYKCLFDTKTYQDDTGKEHTELDIRLAVTKSYLKPYYDLIDHWAAKGYKPVQINE